MRPATQRGRREQESFALLRPERGSAVIELILDLPTQHVAAVSLLAPLLPTHTLCVLDGRPAGAPDLCLPGADTGGVVDPGKLVEGNPQRTVHAASLTPSTTPDQLLESKSVRNGCLGGVG